MPLTDSFAAAKFLLVSCTPLGWPVVPDVYNCKMSSSSDDFKPVADES